MHDGHSHHDHGHKGSAKNKERILLTYMADHNRHHAEELASLAQTLEQQGRGEAAGLIEQARSHFNQGNDLLCAALNLLEESSEGGGE